MPIIDEIKRKQFSEFIDQMDPDKNGLGLTQIYSLYLASVKDKKLVYSCANIRRLLHSNPNIKISKDVDYSKSLKYLIAPRIFKYLKEDSDRGKKARSLYKNMLLCQKKANEPIKIAIDNAKDIDEIDNIKKEYNYDILKNDIEKSRMIATKELNKAINKYILTIDGAKLLALSKVKTIFDSTKVPKRKKTTLDSYVIDAIYTIRSAQSIEEINLYKNKFEDKVKSLKGVKRK